MRYETFESCALTCLSAGFGYGFLFRRVGQIEKLQLDLAYPAFISKLLPFALEVVALQPFKLGVALDNGAFDHGRDGLVSARLGHPTADCLTDIGTEFPID
jgi:hypothetical protein